MTPTQKTRMLPASSPDAPVYPGNGILPILLDEALKSSHLCPVSVPVVPGWRCSSPSYTHRTAKLSRVFFIIRQCAQFTQRPGAGIEPDGPQQLLRPHIDL